MPLLKRLVGVEARAGIRYDSYDCRHKASVDGRHSLRPIDLEEHLKQRVVPETQRPLNICYFCNLNLSII